MLIRRTCAKFVLNVGNQKRYSGYQLYSQIDPGPSWTPNISSQLGVNFIWVRACGVCV